MHCMVSLTDRRLLFRELEGFEVAPQLEMSLTAIERAELVGLRGRLRVSGGGSVVTFGGAMVPRLHGGISALLHDRESSDLEPYDTPEEILDTWSVSLFRGPIAHPGELVVCNRRIHFTPLRRLDELVGAKRFDVPLAAVTQLAVRGWPQRRLVLRTNDGEHVFGVTDPVAHFKALIPILRDAGQPVGPEAISDNDVSAEEIAHLVQAWWTVTDWGPGERVLLASRSLHFPRESIARPGTVLLTTERVLFLPAAGPGRDPHALIFRAEAIVPIETLRAPNELHFVCAGEEVRLMPRGGRPFVQRLYARKKAADEDSTSMVSNGAAISLILGEAQRLRLLRDKEVLLALRRDLILDLGDGLGVVFPGTPDSSLEVGTVVTLEIGHSEGLYRFDATVTGVRPVSGDDVDPSELGRVMLVVAYPEDIQFFNRRNRVRVMMNGPVSARPLTFHEDRGYQTRSQRLPLHLQDLSPLGCGTLGAEPIGIGERLLLKIPLTGGTVEVRGEVVRQHRTSDPELPMCHGLKFWGVPEPVADRIYREVVRRQREALMVRAEQRARA